MKFSLDFILNNLTLLSIIYILYKIINFFLRSWKNNRYLNTEEYSDPKIIVMLKNEYKYCGIFITIIFYFSILYTLYSNHFINSYLNKTHKIKYEKNILSVDIENYIKKKEIDIFNNKKIIGSFYRVANIVFPDKKNVIAFTLKRQKYLENNIITETIKGNIINNLNNYYIALNKKEIIISNKGITSRIDRIKELDKGIVEKNSWYTFLNFLYFSVTTITTLGFGDIVPVSLLGRLLVCFEVIIGTIILGLFLSDLSDSKKSKNEQNKRDEVEQLESACSECPNTNCLKRTKTKKEKKIIDYSIFLK